MSFKKLGISVSFTALRTALTVSALASFTSNSMLTKEKEGKERKENRKKKKKKSKEIKKIHTKLREPKKKEERKKENVL